MEVKNFRKNISRQMGVALIVLLNFVFYQESALAQPQANVNVAEATAVVNQYMQALMQGDINIARSQLAEKLLKTKMNTFSNPDYPQFLRKLYKNAEYEIVGSELRDNRMVAVDVLITHSGVEKSGFRLWLEDNNGLGLRIFMETNLSR